MATQPAAPSGPSEPDFQDLLNDILASPEKALDLTPEQAMGVQKLINPYGYVPEAGKGETLREVLAYTTNLRQDYCDAVSMTKVIGFLFRMHDEWEVPAEDRRWLPKSAKRKSGASGDVTAWSTKDILERAKSLVTLAELAVKAEQEAAKAVEAATLAERDAREADLLADEPSGGGGGGGAKTPAGAKPAAADSAKKPETAEAGSEGDGGGGKKPEEPVDPVDPVAAARERASAALKAADDALAKSHALRYTAMYEMRKAGMESDDRIDDVAKAARRFPKVASVIDQNPIDRKALSQIEMPAKLAKGVITNFLRTWFEFNPDAHVRSALDEVVLQKSKGTVEIPGFEGRFPVDKDDPSRPTLEQVLADPPAFASEEDKAAFESLTETQRLYNSTCHLLRDGEKADAFRYATRDVATAERFRRYLFNVSAAGAARAAATVIPPADTFHRLRYYGEVNYEEIRTAVEAIYHLRPDLDWTMMPLAVIEGASEAELQEQYDNYKMAHEDEIISDLKRIPMNRGWAMLGDWKANRAKIEFYNKNTEVIKRILDRHAEDKKLGADLMRKRVKKLKAKNIAEAGPDDPGLAGYAAHQSGSNPQALGAEKVLSDEDRLRLEATRGNLKAARELEVVDEYRATIKRLTAESKVRKLTEDEKGLLERTTKDLDRALEMLEVPEDAIQVDVFKTDGKSLSKTKFFTQAEKPKAPSQQRELAPFAQEHLQKTLEAERRARVQKERALAAAEGGGGAK